MGPAADKHGVRESFAKVTFLFAKNGHSRIKEFWSKPTYWSNFGAYWNSWMSGGTSDKAGGWPGKRQGPTAMHCHAINHSQVHLQNWWWSYFLMNSCQCLVGYILSMLNMCDSLWFNIIHGGCWQPQWNFPPHFWRRHCDFSTSREMALEKERHVFCGSTALVLPCSWRNAAQLEPPKSFNLRPCRRAKSHYPNWIKLNRNNSVWQGEMELAALKVPLFFWAHHIASPSAFPCFAEPCCMYQEEELHSRLKQAQDTSEAPIRFDCAALLSPIVTSLKILKPWAIISLGLAQSFLVLSGAPRTSQKTEWTTRGEGSMLISIPFFWSFGHRTSWLTMVNRHRSTDLHSSLRYSATVSVSFLRSHCVLVRHSVCHSVCVGFQRAWKRQEARGHSGTRDGDSDVGMLRAKAIPPHGDCTANAANGFNVEVNTLAQLPNMFLISFYLSFSVVFVNPKLPRDPRVGRLW